jgi:hypothetical protein
MAIRKFSTTSVRQALLSKADSPISTAQTFTNVQSYTYTGSNVTFNVPAGITQIICHLWAGAGGGANGEGYFDQGGAGGYSYGILNVSSISTLIIQVGGGGTRQSNTRTARVYPNGGFGGTRTGYVQGNGGGRSAIFNGSVSFANALLVAGGGGGGSGHGGGGAYITTNCGGYAGGGLIGISCTGGYNNSTAGGGGTQTAGGESSSENSPTQTSGQLAGGDRGNGVDFVNGGANTGGGGGDGYYGGGSNVAHAGGGGGSGYTHPTLVTDGQTLSSGGPGIGKNGGPFNPPNITSAYWSPGVGVAGTNADGGPGKVVLIY